MRLKWLRELLRPTRAVEPTPLAFRAPDPDPNVFQLRGFDFYVKLDQPRRAEMLASVRAATTGRGTTYDQVSHAVVLWHDFRPPESLLQKLSGELNTEVIWLSFQKQVDAFEYARWQSGRKLRHLTFGCHEAERTWERVEGEPGAWETAAIFDQRRLEKRLAVAATLGTSSAEEAAALRDVFNGQQLSVGSEEPNITAIIVAGATAEAHALPGWR